MNIEALTRQFARIGASLEVAELPSVRGRAGATNFSLDIREAGRKEFYLLEVAKPAIETLDFQVLNSRPDLRHLVLMGRNEPSQGISTKEKFLCGHDERHWFVAGLPGATAVVDVVSAMESLKPREAAEAQRRLRVRPQDRNKRHNAGFIRQGEWFFVPEPQFRPRSTDIVLRNEPLSRGAGSKPHMVTELLRRGGELVYVNTRTQVMLNVDQFRRAVRAGTIRNTHEWVDRRLTAFVYVRGKVSHADHKTIELQGWHRVAMNREPTTNTVRFLD